MLAGGTDLISLMKEYVDHAQAVVNIKDIKDLGGISAKRGGGLRIGALVDVRRISPTTRRSGTNYPSLVSRQLAASAARRSATWERSAATSASGRAAGTSAPGNGLLA